MSKTCFLSKATTVAILIALILASFPMTNVAAKGNTERLEQKWDQLVTNFYQQKSNHDSAHNWVDHWMMADKGSSSAKAEVSKHLSICNSAIIAAENIVAQHSGFDAKGKVTDKAAANKSIKDLSYYLQRHAGSIRSLDKHIN